MTISVEVKIVEKGGAKGGTSPDKAHKENAKAKDKSAAASKKLAKEEDGLSSSVGTLTKFVSGMTPEVLAVAAACAVYGGALAGVAMGFREAISAVEARRSFVNTADALGLGVVKGEELLSTIRKLQKSVPQSQDQLAKWANALQSAGMTDMSRIEHSLLSAASAEAVMAGGGEKLLSTLEGFQRTISASRTNPWLAYQRSVISPEQLAGTGITQQDMAKALGISVQQFQYYGVTAQQGMDTLIKLMEQKGKTALGGKMLGLEVQARNLKEGFQRLFEKVNVEPFLNVLRMLSSLFDENTAVGKQFTRIFTGFFTLVGEIGSKTIIFLLIWFLKFALVGVKLYNSVLRPILTWFKNLLSTKTSITVLTAAWYGLIVVLGIFAALLAVAAIGAAVLLAPLIIAIGIVLVLLGGLAYAVWWVAKNIGKAWDWMTDSLSAAWSWVKKQFGKIWDYFSDLAIDAYEWGANIVKGLSDGIKSQLGLAKSTSKDLSDEVTKAITDNLKIKSPSRVMFAIGGHVGSGLALGMEASRRDVERASSGLAFSATSADYSRTSSKSMTVNVGGITIQGGGASASELTEEAVVAVFERMALAQGVT